MKRLLTFDAFVPKNINETFVPRNIEKRAKDLEIIKAKELAEFEIFFKEFQKNFESIKDKISSDPKEQLFIDLMNDCHIKTDQLKFPFSIILFKDNILALEYDWGNDIFWYSDSKIWMHIKKKLNMSHEDLQQFIAYQLESYFNFRPSTIETYYYG